MYTNYEKSKKSEIVRNELAVFSGVLTDDLSDPKQLAVMTVKEFETIKALINLCGDAGDLVVELENKMDRIESKLDKLLKKLES